MAEPEFDQTEAHRFFSAHCFNKVWELIEKDVRTAAEDQQMIRLNQASMWHWTQREDCTDKNLSIGHWQASRIYALLKQPENAKYYGQLALEYSQGQGPFYQGYGHEAMARAQMVAGELDVMNEHLEAARALAAEIEDREDRKLLEGDLSTIQ